MDDVLVTRRNSMFCSCNHRIDAAAPGSGFHETVSTPSMSSRTARTMSDTTARCSVPERAVGDERGECMPEGPSGPRRARIGAAYRGVPSEGASPPLPPAAGP
jgi:hypothetical protein